MLQIRSTGIITVFDIILSYVRIEYKFENLYACTGLCAIKIILFYSDPDEIRYAYH